ncbi:sulfatase-like hydrolase/transferase [Tateyamaria omphalii]|uniref:Sulfatase-like protein n=1 Tax=Tateyamaria omphalii TaxID=299262 RepID=A0A1P8N1C4_9RHOB|nr:sulfatase-like hydrolase/transferase [Tateyamaria omphalii]APX14121.1 sulfatase-like protein [Tateyamaria omphalii]
MTRGVGLTLAAAVIFAVLVLPNHPGTMKWSALNRWPLELPVLLLGALAIGPRWGVTYAAALALVFAVIIKVADYGMFSAFNRTFNPVLDLFLVGAGLSLLQDSIGTGLAALAVMGGALALILLFLALERSLRAWARLSPPKPVRLSAAVLALLGAGWAAADAGHHLEYWRFDKSPPGTAWTTRLTVKRGIEVQQTATELARFAEAAQKDAYADASGLLNALEGRDVILIWIESYGRASFDNPLYAPTHLGTLHAAQAEIAQTGMAMKSGWLTAPTSGGQSWLAHGALASGLWTSDNGRYKAMLASGQRWLFHFAQDAGYRTTAIMPAITVGWPESLVMGFDQIFPASDIPYKGDPFRWVTMPDQFTLAAYPALLTPDTRPDFVQIALISSHAPWTPIADMVPWDAVDDGTIFNDMAARGPAPKDLWRDQDAVRDAYRRSVDYSLRATFAHVARLGDAAPLIIVAGDHQAAGFVAGSDNKDVAVHMIGPPDVLDRITHWEWTDGLIPSPDGPVRRMDSFRNAFLDAFTYAQVSEMVGK